MNPNHKSLLAMAIRKEMDAHFTQVRYAHAALLARAGRFSEAEALICQDSSFSVLPTYLDLLARIAYQQRNFKKAKRLWEQALERDPCCPVYLRAVRHLDALEHFHDLVSPWKNLRRLATLLAQLGKFFISICRNYARWIGGLLKRAKTQPSSASEDVSNEIKSTEVSVESVPTSQHANFAGGKPDVQIKEPEVATLPPPPGAEDAKKTEANATKIP